MKPSKTPMVPLNSRVPKVVKIRLETLAGQSGKTLSDFAREVLTRVAGPRRPATMADLTTSATPKWPPGAIHRAHLSVLFRVEMQQEQIIDLLTQGLPQDAASELSRPLLEVVAQLDAIATTLTQLRDDMRCGGSKGRAS
ncbi:hypothetical protein [Rhodoferax koreensis]|nr:hypothetical protein [Rhodoferax koreense]